MATDNSTVVDNLATSIQRKSAYRGNVQWIPVECTLTATQGTLTVTLSDTLPPNSELVAVDLECTAIPGTTQTIDIGYVGDIDAVLDGVDVSSAANVKYPNSATAGLGAPIAVGGKTLIATIIIVTDE
jgi:hypothetical protein